MSRRSGMPSLATIVDHWRESEQAWARNGRPDGAFPFPRLLALAIGWDEPFCFRCGWLAPSKDPYAANPTWANASGWLERAHLRNAATGGPNTPDNLVPLCVLCHKAMPTFATSRDRAVAWVAGHPNPHGETLWQQLTDELYGEEKWIRFPGFLVINQLRTRYREWLDAQALTPTPA